VDDVEQLRTLRDRVIVGVENFEVYICTLSGRFGGLRLFALVIILSGNQGQNKLAFAHTSPARLARRSIFWPGTESSGSSHPIGTARTNRFVTLARISKMVKVPDWHIGVGTFGAPVLEQFQLV
jgi:hypothetical protein